MVLPKLHRSHTLRCFVAVAFSLLATPGWSQTASPGCREALASIGRKPEPQTCICPLERIEGFDAAYEKAVRVLPSKTRDLEQVVIYVTRSHDLIYAHSNYLPSADNKNAMKLATNESNNLKAIFYNLVQDGLTGDPSADPVVRKKISSLHSRNTKYILDQELFSEAGTVDLDLDDASQLFIAIPGESKPRPLLRCEMPRGPPATEMLAFQLKQNLFVQASPRAEPSKILLTLDKQPFRVDDFVGINLVEDSATKNALYNSKFSEKFSSPRTRMDVEDSFAKASGKLLTTLGHVEGEDVVVRDAGGAEVMRVGLAELTALAKEHNVTLVGIGCGTAGLVPTGVHNKIINSLRVARQVIASLDTSKTRAEFLGNLAADDMKLVLPTGEDITGGKTARLSVMERVGVAASPLEQTGLVIVYLAASSTSRPSSGR